jgi:hypothetical protein
MICSVVEVFVFQLKQLTRVEGSNARTESSSNETTTTTAASELKILKFIYLFISKLTHLTFEQSSEHWYSNRNASTFGGIIIADHETSEPSVKRPNSWGL